MLVFCTSANKQYKEKVNRNKSAIGIYIISADSVSDENLFNEIYVCYAVDLNENQK